MLKAAAALSALSGLGFGGPCAYGVWYFARRKEVWTFLGFPTYGGGSFERLGIRTTVPLLLLFLLVCVAELAVAWLLWNGSRSGAMAALALLPVEFVFWIGFALPLGPILGIARTILILMTWSSLSIAR